MDGLGQSHGRLCNRYYTDIHGRSEHTGPPRVTSVVTFSQARCVSCDAARADGQAFSLHAVNMFSFAAFFTARATLCVIRYDHLGMKLGTDVQEWKFSHRLWTSISDARICKRCSVNQTSFHIPTVYSHFSLIFHRFLACGLQCVLQRIHTMWRRIGDRSAGSSVPSPSPLDRARTRISTKIGSITSNQRCSQTTCADKNILKTMAPYTTDAGSTPAVFRR